MTVREINRIDDLAPLRSAWQGLLARTPRATFFQSLDWLEDTVGEDFVAMGDRLVEIDLSGCDVGDTQIAELAAEAETLPFVETLGLVQVDDEVDAGKAQAVALDEEVLALVIDRSGRAALSLFE